MGYACPVCEAPQADGEHLANHLAFAALLHEGPHEAWLDERVPDWTDRDPDGLAADVVDHAEPVDHETVFEDTTGEASRGRPDVGHGHVHRGEASRGRPDGAAGGLDPEARRIVEEAMEMTRERRAGGDREGTEEDHDRSSDDDESDGGRVE